MADYQHDEKDDFDGECLGSVHFEFLAYSKLRTYINNVEAEVSGLGEIKVDRKDNKIIVKDVFLIEQEVTSSSTKLDPEGIMKFYHDRLKLNPKDRQRNYKLWWHSHFDFNVFWSGQDDKCINGLDNDTKRDNWLLSVVGNQDGELLVRIDLFYPIRMTLNHVPYTCDLLPEKAHKGLVKEIKRKVREPAPVVTSPAIVYPDDEPKETKKILKKHGKDHPSYIKHLMMKKNSTKAEQKRVRDYWKNPANTTEKALVKYRQEAMPFSRQDDVPPADFEEEESRGNGIAGGRVKSLRRNGDQEYVDGVWGQWWNGEFYPDDGRYHGR